MKEQENTLTLTQVQQRVDQYISQFEEGYFDPQTLIVRFCEELGELAREVSHQFGVKKKKPGEPAGDMPGEIGDLLFILVCLSNSQGYSLEDIFNNTMQKYEVRDKHRWTRKKGEE